MTPEEMAVAAAYGALYGIVYAAYGIATKKQKDEPVSFKKALRTLVMFGASGIVVSLRGGDLTEAMISQHTGEVAVVGIAFDMAYSKLKRAYRERAE